MLPVIASFLALTAGAGVASAVPVQTVCAAISGIISKESAVFYPGSPQYANDIWHAYTTSSQNSTCSVEPGTVADTAVILRLLGSTKTPFAVKGGGHGYNPGASSTSGVTISMARFNRTVYDANTQNAIVGSGNVWDNVYKALEPYGRNAVGGRLPGIGVAGFTLGGGYSWHTNQYGLALDNVAQFEIALPNGSAVNVTSTSYPDLYFALRGGYNNYGIVTRFWLRTFKQGKIWGGLVYHTGASAENITAGTLDYIAKNDPKASLLVSYGWLSGTLGIVSMLFYDGPEAPAGLFDAWLNSPTIATTVASNQNFTSFYGVLPAGHSPRAIHNTMPTIEYNAEFLRIMLNETTFWGPQLAALDPKVQLTYTVEPFVPSFLSHGSNSAYPPSRSIAYQPMTFEIIYSTASADAAAQRTLDSSTKVLRRAASARADWSSGDPVLYGNYAKPSTPLEDIWGASWAKLKTIRNKYDPSGVMNLAGGWKV